MDTKRFNQIRDSFFLTVMIGLIASFSWVSPVGTKPGKPTAQALPVSLETGGTLLARGLFIREWPPDERFFRGCFENDRVI